MKSEAPHKAQGSMAGMGVTGKIVSTDGASPIASTSITCATFANRLSSWPWRESRCEWEYSHHAPPAEAMQGGQLRQEGWLSQTEVVQTTRQRDRAPIWATVTIADLNTATLGTISRVGEVRSRRPRRSTPRSIESRRRTRFDQGVGFQGRLAAPPLDGAGFGFGSMAARRSRRLSISRLRASLHLTTFACPDPLVPVSHPHHWHFIESDARMQGTALRQIACDWP